MLIAVQYATENLKKNIDLNIDLYISILIFYVNMNASCFGASSQIQSIFSISLTPKTCLLRDSMVFSRIPAVLLAR